jgi:hypothetical protein
MTLVASTAGYDEDVSVDEAEEGEVDALVKKMAEFVIQVGWGAGWSACRVGGF